MKKKTFISRLCRNILNGRFDWEKYLSPQCYFGKEICTMPLHVSYGLIGFSVHFPYDTESFPQIEYDVELKTLQVGGMCLKQWMETEE